MSISEQFTRIQTARNKIRQKLVSLGLATANDNIETLASSINDINDNGNISVSIKEGETFTIPAGFHSGSGTVSGIAGGGNYNLESKNVTPTKGTQFLTPSPGWFGIGDVTINPIPDLYQDTSSVDAVASDVLSGKTIVASDGSVINGSMSNMGDISREISGLSDEGLIITILPGYTSGGHISLNSDIENALAQI